MKNKITVSMIESFLAKIIACFLATFFAFKGYELISYNFNLPEAKYWTCFFILTTVKYLLNSFKKGE